MSQGYCPGHVTLHADPWGRHTTIHDRGAGYAFQHIYNFESQDWDSYELPAAQMCSECGCSQSQPIDQQKSNERREDFIVTSLPSCGFETKKKLTKPQKYAKKAKRQTNMREIAQIEHIAHDHNKPHATLLAARVSMETIDALHTLKAQLEGGS